MGQSDNLPKLKKIELSAKQMRPPEGSKAVGSLADGTVIWEGPVFAGHPYFKDHSTPEGSKDDGHDRRPVLDKKTGEEVWKLNGKGEKVVQRFQNKRREKIVRFIMADDGNGGAGPRPVPGLSKEEQAHRDREAGHDDYLKQFTAAAQAEGIDPIDLVKRLTAASEGGEEKRKPGRPRKPDPDPVAA